jgi:hypothetical protein
MRLPGTVPKLLPVKSSNVAAIGFDFKNSILYVQFLSADQKKRGSLYKYMDVPPKLYTKFLSATSKGGFLNDWIKGRYHYLGWTGFGWRQEKTLQNRAAQNKIKRARIRAANK